MFIPTQLQSSKKDDLARRILYLLTQNLFPRNLDCTWIINNEEKSKFFIVVDGLLSKSRTHYLIPLESTKIPLWAKHIFSFYWKPSNFTSLEIRRTGPGMKWIRKSIHIIFTPQPRDCLQLYLNNQYLSSLLKCHICWDNPRSRYHMCIKCQAFNNELHSQAAILSKLQ